MLNIRNALLTVIIVVGLSGCDAMEVYKEDIAVGEYLCKDNGGLYSIYKSGSFTDEVICEDGASLKFQGLYARKVGSIKVFRHGVWEVVNVPTQ